MAVEKNTQKRSYGFPLDLESMDSQGIQSQVVKGKSGALITIDLFTSLSGKDYSRAHILAIENKSGSAGFEARWQQLLNGAQNSLNFDIRTRNVVTGVKARDFYAGDIVDAFMSFIQARYPIDRIKFSWSPLHDRNKGIVYPSDNYLQYEEGKARLLRERTIEELLDLVALDEVKKAAALNTWTGKRIAQRHGFTLVESINDEEFIEGFFIRPDQK